jgi:circadian clock protein KaiC
MVNDGIKRNDNKFFKTGIAGFDNLLGVGIPIGSNILVEGGPGSGKTIFCLQVVNNFCARGQKALYMSFEEPEEKLKDHMRSFGWKPEIYEKKGLLKIRRYDALDIARSVEALLSEAKKELLIDVHPILMPDDFTPDIVVVDSLSAIAAAFSGRESRFRIYMEQFFRYLEKNKITSFLIREVAHPTHIGRVYIEKGEAVSFLSDGIISIYNIMDKFGKRSSAIEVLKMRGTNISRKIVQMKIVNGKGIEVYPTMTIGQTLKGNFAFT